MPPVQPIHVKGTEGVCVGGGGARVYIQYYTGMFVLHTRGVGCPGISHPKLKITPPSQDLSILPFLFNLNTFPAPNGITSPIFHPLPPPSRSGLFQ